MVSPSIYGTAATFNADRFTYYKVSANNAYILVPSGYLFEEEDVDCVHLWEVRLTFLREEVVNIPLRLYLLHELMDVDRLKSWVWLVLLH